MTNTANLSRLVSLTVVMVLAAATLSMALAQPASIFAG